MRQKGELMRRRNIFDSKAFPLAVLFFVPLAVYSVTLANGFVGDDNHQVLGNRWITSVYYIPEILRSSVWSFVSGSPTSNYYRPMMHFTYMAAYHAFGLNAWGFHLVNALLHCVNTILVFYTAVFLLPGAKNGGRREGRPGYLPPFIASILFALHPLNTEVVSWVASVPELTFTLFFLLAVNMYLRIDAGRQGFSLPRYILSAVFFMLALLSKETAIVLPAILVAYDFSKKGFAFLKGSLAYLPFIIIALAYMVVRTRIIGGVVHYKNIDLPPGLYLLNILPIIPRYIWKFMMPFPLNASYVFHQVNTPFEAAALISFLFMGAYAAAIFLFRKDRMVFLALLWIVIALLPALYLPAIPGGFAERYFYLPCAAASILIAYALKRVFFDEGSPLVKKSGAAIGFMAVLLAVYAAADVKRASVWKDDFTLWGDTVKKSPDSPAAHAHLAWAAHKKRDFRNAINEYKEVIRIGQDKKTEALFNLGAIYMDTGDYTGAITVLGEALTMEPGSAEAHYNIAMAYHETKDPANAILHYREAIRLNPRNDNAYFNLAWTYQESGDNASAAFFYKGAIELAPQNADSHYNLGAIYESEGRMDEAAKEFESAFRIDHGYKDARARLQDAVSKRTTTDSIERKH